MTGSAVDRVRASYEKRKEERTLEIELWGGDLIAEINLVDAKGARGAFKTLASFAEVEGGDVADLNEDDMADVIAEAVSGLYAPDGNGGREKLVGANGEPILFNGSFGELIGVDDIKTPRQAVFTAFTEGDPPKLNVFSMLTTTSQIAAWLVDPSGTPEAALTAKGR